MPLAGRVALVTGGARGIGRAIVDAFAEAGCSGVTLDTDVSDDELPSGFVAQGGDVTHEDDIRTAVTRAVDTHGHLDIVVANAGLVPPWRETEHIDLDEWDRAFAINVRGVVATIKQAVPAMRNAGGSVIVLGSLNSRRAHPRQCLYTATKHAVLGIVRSTALDLGRYGIRVNAIGPGPIATDALLERIEKRAGEGEPSVDDVLAGFDDDAALGRIATVDDVASTAVFLAGTGAAGITGQIIPVDGGLP